LDQWTFYVLQTQVLDKAIPKQKTITLKSLQKLDPTKCSFEEIRAAIEEI
jgi:hypothetical protein